jgi:hypothetical protein
LHIITDVAKSRLRIGLALAGLAVTLAGAPLALQASFQGTVWVGAICLLLVGIAGILARREQGNWPVPDSPSADVQGPPSPPTPPPDLIHASDGEHMIFFLSYSRSLLEDSGLVEKFVSDLQLELRMQHHKSAKCGYRDLQDIPFGEEFPKEVCEVLDSCTAVVALLSPDFRNRPWCRMECQFVMGRQARVLPVYWSGGLAAVIPDWLQKQHYDSHEFSSAYREKGLRRLCQDACPDYRKCIRLLADVLDALDKKPRYAYVVRPSLESPK